MLPLVSAWLYAHCWEIVLGLMLGLLLPQRVAEEPGTGDQALRADLKHVLQELEQVVLSVEGQDHIDKDLWATHQVLGVFATEAAAEAAIPPDADLVYNIYLISNLTTGAVRRVEST